MKAYHVCVVSSVSDVKEQLAFVDAEVLEQYSEFVQPLELADVELHTNNFKVCPESASELTVVINIPEPPLIIVVLSEAEVNTGN
jgi:histidyl-tRNA synthetase